MKQCRMCLTQKPDSSFSPMKDNKDRLYSYCRPCSAQRQRGGHKRTPEEARANSLKQLYGLTLERYAALFQQQSGRCGICRRHQSEFSQRLFVDHDHTTKQVRGLLCNNCNRLLGNAHDRLEVLANAMEYLRAPVLI